MHSNLCREAATSLAEKGCEVGECLLILYPFLNLFTYIPIVFNYLSVSQFFIRLVIHTSGKPANLFTSVLAALLLFPTSHIYIFPASGFRNRQA